MDAAYILLFLQPLSPESIKLALWIMGGWFLIIMGWLVYEINA